MHKARLAKIDHARHSVEREHPLQCFGLEGTFRGHLSQQQCSEQEGF